MKSTFVTDLVKDLDSIHPGVFDCLEELNLLPDDAARQVLGVLLSSACQSQHIGNIQAARGSFLRIPSFWLASQLEQAIRESLDLDDEWEYRRLLELLEETAPQLLEHYLEFGERSNNPDLREAAADNMTIRAAIRRADALLPGDPAPENEVDPRWQAILKVADFIESHPEEVWGFIRRWGNHPQEDLRTAIACCLLEHLLEYHFDLYFPRVEECVARDPLFADTFRRCWKLGQSELPENARRFDELKKWCQKPNGSK